MAFAALLAMLPLTGWDAFYLFAPAEGEGFVIVAADDRVRPVLVRLDFGRTSNPNSVGFFIDNIVIERLSGTGIHDFATDQTLNVYPNPTNGHITIEGMPEGGRAELYDATGRLVKVSTSPRINLSDCPASVHLLRIISTDGVATQRVIIRK